MDRFLRWMRKAGRWLVDTFLGLAVVAASVAAIIAVVKLVQWLIESGLWAWLGSAFVAAVLLFLAHWIGTMMHSEPLDDRDPADPLEKRK